MFSVGNFMTAYEKLYQSMKRFVFAVRELAKPGNQGVHPISHTCIYRPAPFVAYIFMGETDMYLLCI